MSALSDRLSEDDLTSLARVLRGVHQRRARFAELGHRIVEHDTADGQLLNACTCAWYAQSRDASAVNRAMVDHMITVVAHNIPAQPVTE